MLKFLLLIAAIYFSYRLYTWLPQRLSGSMICSRCDGKGYWYGLRHRESCKDCKGTGRIEK